MGGGTTKLVIITGTIQTTFGRNGGAHVNYQNLLHPDVLLLSTGFENAMQRDAQQKRVFIYVHMFCGAKRDEDVCWWL